MCTSCEKKVLSRHRLALVPLLLTLGAGVAGAQGGEGWKWFQKGVAKYGDADFDSALVYFGRALQDQLLLPKLQTDARFYLAFSHLKMGDSSSADVQIDAIRQRNPEEELPPIPEFEEFKGYYNSKKGAVCRLEVNTRPAGATVFLDNAERGPSPQTFENLKPGKVYAVRAEKQDYISTAVSVPVNGDTALTLELKWGGKPRDTIVIRDTIKVIKYVNVGPGVRTYLIGAGAGAGLGLLSGFLGVHFDNQSVLKTDEYVRARDAQTHDDLKNQIKLNRTLGDVFHYASYPLMAVGFFAGFRLAERFLPEELTSLGGEQSRTRVCCTLDKDLNISLGVRRSIW